MCKRKKNETKENKIELESNSPVVDFQSYGDYVEVIHKKIQDNDVKNIGIIATYGAGKSSLLKTYNAKYPKEKKVTISLANFNATEPKNSGKPVLVAKPSSNPQVQDIECEVEKSILEQFLFSENKRKMPNSKMNRIGLSHFWYSVIFSICTLLLISMIICAILEFKHLLPSSKGGHFYWFFVLAVLSAIILLFLLVYNRKLDRIAIKDIEATFCESNGSILNIFIDELLYFFRVTKTSIVIIEDLDRFNNTNLFSKLREINFLINNSKIVKQKVTFVYAVKDDLFITEEDRAKFFEFIVSLTPVLNSDNATDYLKKSLTSCPNEMMLPDSYIAEITQFIQEMRILKNIINDYKVYYLTLDIKNLDVEDKAIKLFSLMVYKNLRPKDFAKLQFSEGELADVFKSKNLKIEAYAKKLNDEIKSLNEKKLRAKQEQTEDFENLKNMIIGIIFYKGGRGASGTDIKGVKTFENFGPHDYFYISRYNAYYLSVEEIENELGESLVDYENRIKDKSIEIQSEIDNKLAAKLSEKRTIQNYSLKEIMTKYNESFNIKDDLIRYLLVNELIAEDYLDYIIKVGDTVISSNDRAFIKDVLAKKDIEYSKKLDKPELVVMKILPERFTDKYVLNYDLVNYLFNIKEQNIKKDNILKYLASGEDSADHFIISYLIDGNSNELLIDNLIDKCERLTLIVLSSNALSKELKIEYLRNLIVKQNINIIKSQNIEGIINTHISALEKAVDLISPVNPKKFIKVVESLSIKLIDLTCESIYFDTAKHLVDISAYQLNQENLRFILFDILGIDVNAYSFAYFTAILECGNKQVSEYCVNNSKNVLHAILSLDSCCEKQKAIELILTDNRIVADDKEKFIKKLQNPFNYFETLDNKLLSIALNNNKIKCSWEEIIKIQKSGKAVFGDIYEFIHLNIKELSVKELNDKDLILAICNHENNDTPERIAELKLLSKSFKTEIIVSEIDEDKVSAVLVVNDVIKPTEENVMDCIDRIQTISALFIKNSKLIHLIQLDDFEFDFVSALLQSHLTDEFKITLLNSLGGLYEPDEKTAKELANYLLTEKEVKYPFVYLKAIFENSEINQEDKVIIFENYIGSASKAQLFSLFKPWSDKFEELETRGKASVGFEEINSKVLTALSNKGLIDVKPFIKVKWIYKKF